MAPILEGYVRNGWKVFLGSKEIGKVASVTEDELTVERGTLVKRAARLPARLVAEADEGIVDLLDNDETRTLLNSN